MRASAWVLGVFVFIFTAGAGDPPSPSASEWHRAWKTYSELSASTPIFVSKAAAEDLAERLAGLSDDAFRSAVETVTAESIQDPKLRARLRDFLEREVLGNSESIQTLPAPALARLRERLERQAELDATDDTDRVLQAMIQQADLMFFLTYGARGVWGLVRAWSVLPGVKAPSGRPLTTALHKGRFVVNSLFRFGRYEAQSAGTAVTYERALQAQFADRDSPGVILTGVTPLPLSGPPPKAVRKGRKALLPPSAEPLPVGASCEIVFARDGIQDLGRAEVHPEYDHFFIRPRGTSIRTFGSWMAGAFAAGLAQVWIENARSRVLNPRSWLRSLETNSLLPQLNDLVDQDAQQIERLDACVRAHFSESKIFSGHIQDMVPPESDCAEVLNPLLQDADQFLAFFDHYAGLKSRLVALERNIQDLTRAGLTEPAALSRLGALRATAARLRMLTSPTRLDGFVRALKTLVHAQALKDRKIDLPDVSDLGDTSDSETDLGR